MTERVRIRKGKTGDSIATTKILFGILILGFMIFGLTQWLHLKKSGDSNEFLLPSLHADAKIFTNPRDFDTVEIVRTQPTAEKFVFVRKNQGWEMTEPYEMRASSRAVDDLVNQLITARRDKSDLSSDLKEYELDAPRTVVSLKKGADKELWVNLGRESPGEASKVVYVTSSDRPDQPLAVKSADLAGLFKNLNDFLSLELLNVSALNTTYLDVQRPKQEPIVLEKSSDSRWVFKKPDLGEADYEGDGFAPSGADKPITGIKELLETVGSIQVLSKDDFATLEASPKNIEDFGLEKDKPATMRLEVKRNSDSLIGGADKPVTLILLVGKKVEPGKDGKAEQYYVRLGDERAVARVAAKPIEVILKTLADPTNLRNRDLAQLDIAKTDAIDITNASGSFRLRRYGKPETWKLLRESTTTVRAFLPSVNELLQEITFKRQIKDFPTGKSDADLGFDKPTAIVSIWVDGLPLLDKKIETKKDDKDEGKKEVSKKDDKKEPEKKVEEKATDEPKLKTDKPTVKLIFGKKEKGLVNVKRVIGASETVVAVPEQLLATVSLGPLTYFSRELPTFFTNDVSDFEIEREGMIYKVQKEQKDASSPVVWKFKLPKDLEGQTANAGDVDRMLTELSKMLTDKFVAEKADPKTHGFDKPSVRAVVTIKTPDNKTEDRVYWIGKPTDGSGVFVKQGERDLVFVVLGRQLETLLSKDFQDPTVFHFDASKVKQLDFLGWKEAGKDPRPLQLQRADANGWQAKLPKDDGPLDIEQIDGFLAGLADLKAARFVSRKAKPKPEQKLDEKTCALRIEIRLDGAPLILTIGALDAKANSYFAQSSTLPESIFLLPQPRFEKLLKEGPKYFMKTPAK